MFDIAVIIINYNSSEFTINCIKSIIEKTDSSLSYQIIITDNASNSDDFENLKTKIKEITYQHITLVRSKINTGFGGGNMSGVQLANAKYYAFVNNDSIFENDCLSIIKNEMDENENYGICGPLCHNEKGQLLPTLDYFASPLKEIFGRSILNKLNPKEYPSRKKEFKTPQKGQFVAGSFMMVRANDFDTIGGFDTNIFLYYEETDLCKRLRKINKYAYLIPEAKFIHFHGVSTPKSMAIKKELKVSLLYIIRKHYGFIGHKIVLFFFIIKYFFGSLIKPKKWPLFLLILKGAPLKYSLKQNQKLVQA